MSLDCLSFFYAKKLLIFAAKNMLFLSHPENICYFSLESDYPIGVYRILEFNKFIFVFCCIYYPTYLVFSIKVPNPKRLHNTMSSI